MDAYSFIQYCFSFACVAKQLAECDKKLESGCWFLQALALLSAVAKSEKLIINTF